MMTSGQSYLPIRTEFTLPMQAQSTSDPAGQAETGSEEKKYQAKAPAAQPFGKEAFEPSHATVLRWLGMAGFLINSRGTTVMTDIAEAEAIRTGNGTSEPWHGMD